MAENIRIGIPVFNGVDLLDVTGPLEVLSTSVEENPLEVLLISLHDRREFESAPRIEMRADCTSDEAPKLDVLLVPGGPGVNAMMESEAVRSWLDRQGQEVTWVTSVCAGALLLGAAGLLQGFTATTHWASLPALALFPEVNVAPGYPRVVMSGNRMTSGGVTSGLDLAVSLKAVLLGEQAGKDAELFLQYDPQPPYHVGRPDIADPITMADNARAFQQPIADRIEIIRGLLGS